MADIVITNGKIVDGSGQKPYEADIVIDNGIITLIGKADNVISNRKINALGKTVCPGFIDIHSHADLSIYKSDHPTIFEPLIRQGITTFIGGNCGMSLAPINRAKNLTAQKFYLEGFTGMDFEGEIHWDTFGSYLDVLEEKGVALNMGLLCPHGLIRLQSVGQKNSPATQDDIDNMKSVLNQAMEEGAFGLSVGLQYFPGLNSTTDELIQLGSVLSKYNGRFCAHMRSYTTNTIYNAMEEVAEVAMKNSIHGQISHIFTLPWIGPMQAAFMKFVKFLAKHPHLANVLVPTPFITADMKKILKKLDQYNSVNGDYSIGMDVMPTTTGFTHLLAFFPPWVLADSKEDIIKRATDKETRKKIIRDIETGKPIWPHVEKNTWSLNIFKAMGYDSTTIMAVASEKNKHLEGKNIMEIANEKNLHPVEAALDLLIEEDGRVLVYESPGEPEDPFTIKTQFPALAHPNVSIVTDTILMGFGRPSYLFYGCYPKYLGYHSREKKLLPMPQAIRKCTALPAESMGIEKRGMITENNFADILVIDENTIGTTADFKKPDVFPNGINYVIINGKIVVERGKYDKDALAGQILRKQ